VLLGPRFRSARRRHRKAALHSQFSVTQVLGEGMFSLNVAKLNSATL
jgi:hypothetical protein